MWLRPSTCDGHGWTNSTRSAQHRIKHHTYLLPTFLLLLTFLLPFLLVLNSSLKSPPLLLAALQPLWMTEMRVYLWDYWDDDDDEESVWGSSREHLIPQGNKNLQNTMRTFTDVHDFLLQFKMISSSDGNQSWNLLIGSLKQTLADHMFTRDHMTPAGSRVVSDAGVVASWMLPVKTKTFFFLSSWVCHRWCRVSWDDEAFDRSDQRPGPQRIHCGFSWTTWAGVCWSSEAQSQRDLLFLWSAGAWRGR